MSEQTYRRILTLFALALVSANLARAQSTVSSGGPTTPVPDPWQFAQSEASSRKKLGVVTFDQPQRRQTCHVQSFTADKLVCSHVFGGPRTFSPQQVVALILPGDGYAKLRFALGANIGLGAAIWGTVVLTATCVACAVATGIVAFLFFDAAGAVLIGDDTPDRLLYLAPGQQLTGKLRVMNPLKLSLISPL